VDERTTHHSGYQLRQKKRKRIEEVFGWTIGLLRKVGRHGLERIGWMFTFTAAAYSLVRIRQSHERHPAAAVCLGELEPQNSPTTTRTNPQTNIPTDQAEGVTLVSARFSAAC
jgi:hypothetical protein